jgi:hypothetical protein
LLNTPFIKLNKMHHVFIAQLKSNAISTDRALAKLLLNPLIHLLGRGDIVRELLDYAKTSRDEEFIRLLLDYRNSSIKS